MKRVQVAFALQREALSRVPVCLSVLHARRLLYAVPEEDAPGGGDGVMPASFKRLMTCIRRWNAGRCSLGRESDACTESSPCRTLLRLAELASEPAFSSDCTCMRQRRQGRCRS